MYKIYNTYIFLFILNVVQFKGVRVIRSRIRGVSRLVQSLAFTGIVLSPKHVVRDVVVRAPNRCIM